MEIVWKETKGDKLRMQAGKRAVNFEERLGEKGM